MVEEIICELESSWTRLVSGVQVVGFACAFKIPLVSRFTIVEYLERHGPPLFIVRVRHIRVLHDEHLRVLHLKQGPLLNELLVTYRYAIVWHETKAVFYRAIIENCEQFSLGSLESISSILDTIHILVLKDVHCTSLSV